MATYTQILYQIIFSPKERKPVLNKANRSRLYKYIWGILKNKKCHLYRIGGIEDHIHIATHLHPSVALSGLVKDIKIASSEFIKNERLFPDFDTWQRGYSAFTYSFDAKDNLIEYIKNQEEHHKKETFREELIRLYKEHGIDFDKRYLL